MATPLEEERSVFDFCPLEISLTVFAVHRERARELERRSRQLPSPSRRRTSGTGIPGHPTLPLTPPATNASRQRRLAPTPIPTPRSEPSGAGTNARSIAQRARRERERQQRLLSTGSNVPPTPPPSNHRTRPGKHLKEILSRLVIDTWLLQDHQPRCLLHEHLIMSR